jgi:hypothetical protein
MTGILEFFNNSLILVQAALVESLIKSFYRISWNVYLTLIRFTGVERIADVSEILTFSTGRSPKL